MQRDILELVRSVPLATQAEWIAIVTRAANVAEAERRRFARKDRDRARSAHAFEEQCGAVLFWPHHNTTPDTRHDMALEAIRLISGRLHR